MFPRMPLAFRAMMVHCWLIANLLPTGTLRSFSSELLSVHKPTFWLYVKCLLTYRMVMRQGKGPCMVYAVLWLFLQLEIRTVCSTTGYIFVWRDMRGCGNLYADYKIAKNGETVIAFIKVKLFILCFGFYMIVILYCYCKLLIVQSWKKMCK